MNDLNVIIADDHPIVLFGIRKSLEQIEWVNVVGEFEDSTALINSLSMLDANVLITDLSMPGDKYGDGITLIKYIKRHYPQLSIIVLTMNNNPAILSTVLDLDIAGIVLKQGAPTDLPKALAALQNGKKFTPESVTKQTTGKNQRQRLWRQTSFAKRERSTSPVRRGLSGHRDRQETQPQYQDYQQPEEIGDDETGRRERHRLTQLPVFHKHDATGQRMIVLVFTCSLKSTPPSGPFAFQVSERDLPHLLAVIGQRLFQHF